MQHGSANHGVSNRKRSLTETAGEGETHVAKKVEADRALFQLRCKEYEITKSSALRVSREISWFVSTDYKVTPLRDCLKLECPNCG